MTKLEVFGTGCPKCQQLAANAEEAARAAGIEYELIKVTDINAIAQAGVMLTPALAIDGQIKVAGKVADAAAIQKMLA